MLRKPLLLMLAGLVLAVAFVAGVTQLFALRYQSGDVYPAYSSLRADPLGVKGLYEALGQLAGVEVRRNYKPLPKLKPPGSVTLVYTGVDRHAMWDDLELLDFNALVLGGSRTIFTFNPIEHSPVAEEEKRLDDEARKKKEEKERDRKIASKSKKLGAKNNKEAPAKENDNKEPGKEKDAKKKKDDEKKKTDDDAKNSGDEEEAEARAFISFKDAAGRWGFAFDYLPASEDKAYHRRALVSDPASGLEPAISWHTALCFKDLKPEWKVLYTCEGKPVVIERKFGSGTLVFATDSFFVSNEALRTERSPKLLAWLFDGPPDIVFDEEHHNVRDEPGMATLARKYHLEGVVFGLILLTALFVWKNAVRFLPAQETAADEGGIVAGKESAEGFVNLLRRSIKGSDILGVCVGEWRKSFPHQRKETAKIDEIFGQEQARPVRQRDVVSAYQAICRSLHRKA